MAIKDLFSRGQGRKMSEKGFRLCFKNDSRMKEVFGNENIAKVLDRPGEKHEFYDLMKGKKAGGLTKSEMKGVFGDLMAGKGRTIDRKEAYAIAKEFFGDEKVRYIMPTKKTDPKKFDRLDMQSPIMHRQAIPPAIRATEMKNIKNTAGPNFQKQSEKKENKESTLQPPLNDQKKEVDESIISKFEAAEKKIKKIKTIFSDNPERNIEKTSSGETYFDSMKRISRLQNSGKKQE